jgi:carbonic anhydrase
MEKSFRKILEGYQIFRKKYTHGNVSTMECLARDGQNPDVMVIACCDSRVDPALILQCDPGDFFVVRNVANIVPPYEKDNGHHGTSAALEFGICFLKVKHLILLGHSQCGGIKALIHGRDSLKQNDFIGSWMDLIKPALEEKPLEAYGVDDYAKVALQISRQNCLDFPWIQKKVNDGQLVIHSWFFEIKTGEILTYCQVKKTYISLELSGSLDAYRPPRGE